MQVRIDASRRPRLNFEIKHNFSLRFTAQAFHQRCSQIVGIMHIGFFC